MSQERIELPPEISTARAALWVGPREAGVTVAVLGPGPGDDVEGFTENAVVGSYMVTLACWRLSHQADEVQASLTVQDVTPGVPARDDGLGLLVLHCEHETWRLHIELSERLVQWNEVYYRLTGGILARKSVGEIRDAEAVIVANAVGQFLAECAA